jgi:hypothetical protein
MQSITMGPLLALLYERIVLLPLQIPRSMNFAPLYLRTKYRERK